MSYPVDYAYYPVGTGNRDHGVIYSRCNSIEAAWNRDVKGVPVPYTGGKKWRKGANGSGVSASSRVLSHYYADEGEKGRYVRKLVRSRERAMWLSEWQEEQNEDAVYGYAVDTYSAGEWFTDDPYEWDSYYGEEDYDDTDSWIDMGCGDPYCDICEREFRIDVEFHTEWEERFGCSLPDCVECYR